MRSVRSITPALQSAPAPSPNTRRSRPPHYRTPLVPARQPPTALHSRPFPHNGVGADTPEVGNPFRSRNLSQPHRQPIERRKTWRAGRRKAPLPAGKIGAENYPRQTNHTRVVHPPRVHSSPHLHVEPPAPPPAASRRPCRHERISPTYQDPHWRQEPHAPQARDTRLHPSPPTCTRFTPAPSSPAASPTRYAPMGDPNRLRQPLSAPPNGAQRGTRPSPPPRSPNAIPRIQLAAASAQNMRHVRRPIELFDPDSFNTTPRTPSQERAHGGILNQLR